MKRTTLMLDDGIFAALRERAAKERRSFNDVVNDLLREALLAKKAAAYRLRWNAFGGNGVQPEVNLEDRGTLWDLMDGRR